MNKIDKLHDVLTDQATLQIKQIRHWGGSTPFELNAELGKVWIYDHEDMLTDSMPDELPAYLKLADAEKLDIALSWDKQGWEVAE